MDAKTDESAGKCPVMHTVARTNRDWWPNQLNIQVLHHNSTLSDPMGEAFDYAKEFKSLDLNAVIKELHALMTDSQEWWPADYGHYGGLMIRMASHAGAEARRRTAAPRGRPGGGGRRPALPAPQNRGAENGNPRQAARAVGAKKEKIRPFAPFGPRHTLNFFHPPLTRPRAAKANFR